MEARRRWDAARYHGASDIQEARSGILLDKLHLRGDETVLDAGCGSGRTTLRLLERLPGGHVIAVDSSPAMVDHARELLGDRATVIHTDLTELDLDGEADAVFSNAVFHWSTTGTGSTRGSMPPFGRVAGWSRAAAPSATWTASSPRQRRSPRSRHTRST